MTEISDVMAFAAANPDYWQELLSSENYPEELRPDERAALDAAVEHIGALAVEILHGCASELTVVLGGRLAKQNKKAATTRKNRVIWLKPPKDLESKLYGITFGIEPDPDGKTVQLFGNLVVKKGSLERFEAQLAKSGVAYSVDEAGYLWAPGLPLKEGDSIPELAKQAAQRTAALLKELENA